MTRKIATCLALAAALACLSAPTAQAFFEIEDFDVTYTNADGSPDTQAGSHPFAMRTSFEVANHPSGEGGIRLDEAFKDILASQVPGLGGRPDAVPTCANSDFRNAIIGPDNNLVPRCPAATALGTIGVTVANRLTVQTFYSTLYNLPAPPGKASAFGFWSGGVPFQIQVGLGEAAPYKIVAGSRGVPQLIEISGIDLTLWGVPADSRHDPLRGTCLNAVTGGSHGNCPAGVPPAPFLTLPRACHGALTTEYASDSWLHPGLFLESGLPNLADPNWVSGSVLTHDDSQPPAPLGLTGCPKLAFSPATEAQPTSRAASSPSGLDFALNVKDEGIDSPTGLASSDIERAVVTLPEGMSANPSLAEGLGVCTEADLARESAFSEAGAGCPSASKIGTVEVETPLLPGKLLKGSLYIAKPYENPSGTLLAMYIVIKNPELGISVTQPLKIEPNPVTGQLTTVAEELPQLPFSHFRLHFREGARSPLATPASCDADLSSTARDPYKVRSVLSPYSGEAPVTSAAGFEFISGPDGSSCPSGGTPPFHPGLIAGSINNAAGRYSPFNVRLSRTDSEQEITHFSIKLPPGITGKLAGIPFCSDGDIAAAKAREGQPHGGQEELDNPSCPATSEVGHTLVGSGVGPSLTYVPGKLYLAGPYNGSPLSIVAITAAKAGPFDLGTVVVREALRINPETAEVFIDATGSDPIPHIIRGIPVHLRDIRVYTDRPDFVLNPTSCNPTSTASTVLGSGTDFASEADDRPVTVATRYQAADCASLPYKPRIALKLKGGTKRGGNPALTATLLPRPGDANSKKVSVALPHSEFLDQAHIKTICTRVQFKAGAGNGAQCPAASVYGKAKAWTPLLSEPLEGPIFLRSSEHPLPDLVLALHGLVDFTAVGRIDSVHGGIRNTFESIPDAPITKVVVEFPGGRKSLLENSTNLCVGKHRAKIEFGAQSGKEAEAKVALKAKCKKHRKSKSSGRASALAAMARAW